MSRDHDEQRHSGHQAESHEAIDGRLRVRGNAHDVCQARLTACNGSDRVNDFRRSRTIRAHAFNDLQVADLQVLSDQIRRHLFADSGECRHERRSHLSSQEARCLHYDAKGECILGFQMKHGEEDDAGQSEALSKGLQER